MTWHDHKSKSIYLMRIKLPLTLRRLQTFARFDEYKRSLKMPEAEETFDLVFYRPLAFVLVKMIYQLPITPNVVTLFSVITGIIAAWFFAIGTSQALVVGGLIYILTNILDCADGQLARLQQSGTLLGRVVDGVADYLISLAIFLGLGIGLSIAGSQAWWLVIVAGISSGIHPMFFDYYQSEFIAVARGEQNFLQFEIIRYSAEILQMKTGKGSRIKIFLLRLYLWYLHLQKQAGMKLPHTIIDADQYRQENGRMIRRWSLLGPTTNRTFLIVCALTGRIEWYLWIVIVAGNAWLCTCYLLQKRRNLAKVLNLRKV
ncbi:MAG: CDP-alcohol phosphatidyltransferase family protein [Ignavibacteriae bacterium]|nr:CDP-alcohol phosphatidyltransferase family protein [Ignavibacteriota bacterium]